MKTEAKIKIKGIKPFLFHTFPIDALDSGKSKSGTTGKNELEWMDTVLMDKNRNLYVLPSYVTGSIREGGKHIKVGKSNLSKKAGCSLECLGSKVYLEGLAVPDTKLLTRDETQDVYLDVRSVVNPATKGRNLRYRIAAKEGWLISAVITWDDFAISKDQMKECIKNAGVFEGIGDGRKIGFGRFELVDFSSKD